MLVAGIAEDNRTVVGREWRCGLASELAQCRRAVGGLRGCGGRAMLKFRWRALYSEA